MPMMQEIPDVPEWFTVAEVAKALRLSKMSVYRLVASGALPSSRFGRMLRISRSDFKTFTGQAS